MDSSGVPPASAERRVLRAIVVEACRFVPSGAGGIAGAGAGAGEGVAPETIDDLVESLLELKELTGGDGVDVLDWISTGLGTAPPGDPGDPTAVALRLRDLLVETDAEADEDPADPDDAEEASRAAEEFGEGMIEVDAK